MWPVDRSSELKQHIETEAILKHELKRLHFENKTLKSRDSVRSLAYSKSQDSVKVLSELVKRPKIIYREARERTDSNPDSINLRAEVMAGRILIDAQESHINGLLDLVAKGDSLIASKMEIIKNQEEQLMKWPERYDNMVAQKDKEIKQEKKKGNKKLGKGLIIGAILGLVLGIL